MYIYKRQMWHFQVEYGSWGEKLLHWFKLCIHDLIRTWFQLESVTFIVHLTVLYWYYTSAILTCVEDTCLMHMLYTCNTH